MTKHVIVGAGAIGGTIGAYMVRGGEDVLFVDVDADHVSAMNRKGLTIQGYKETFTVPVRAVTPDEMPSDMQSVILAVKALATQAAVEQIAPRLAKDGYIVSAQNGLNELVISRFVGADRTIGCFVNFSADYLKPGLIHYGGPGAFYIGELNSAQTQRIQALQSVLSHWEGGPVRITDNIWGYLWGKQAYGAMLFATALTNETMADAIAAYRDVMVDLAKEVLAVAAAEGVTPIGFDGFEPEILSNASGPELDASIERLVAVRRRDQKQRSGIWRDLAVRKRRTEVDAHFQPILAMANQHGLAAPLLRRVVEMIHEIENGQRPLALQNLDELRSLLNRS